MEVRKVGLRVKMIVMELALQNQLLLEEARVWS
jgi:hypothetical protein